jgi:hypothetical protein
MNQIPIACTLSPGDAVVRVDEWKAFLEKNVVEIDRTTQLVRLRLRDQGDSVLSATDLAQREKACCAFLDFRIAILAEAVWLEVAIPVDAGVTLNDLSLLFAN